MSFGTEPCSAFVGSDGILLCTGLGAMAVVAARGIQQVSLAVCALTCEAIQANVRAPALCSLTCAQQAQPRFCTMHQHSTVPSNTSHVPSEHKWECLDGAGTFAPKSACMTPFFVERGTEHRLPEPAS